MVIDPAISENGSTAGGRLIIHAPNVHTGGGAVLLNALLADRAEELVLICDERMPVVPQIEAANKVCRVAPNIFARFAAERRLHNMARSEDVVLAFGNLPPLYRLKAKTTLFLQNRYLVDPGMSLSGFALGARLRLAVERIWLRRCVHNVDRIIVQTKSMADLVLNVCGQPADVVPFTQRLEVDSERRPNSKRRHDFIYVSSGEPHKNHSTLIEAWGLLADRGVRPSLALTLSKEHSPDVLELVDKSNKRNMTQIANLGRLLPEEINKAYLGAGALIFPSFGESFGLPLVEATGLGLPILASELDFVRDVARPTETFDPRSPRSIARAVCRFMGLPDDPDTLVSASAFLEQVCNGKS